MLEIRVSLHTDEIDDPVELERLHSSLLYALEDLGAGEVEPIRSDELEPGTRGVGAVLLGFLRIVLPGPALTVLGPLIDTLSEYSKRTDQKVRLKFGDDEIEISGSVDEHGARLIKTWETRYSSEGGNRLWRSMRW